MAQVTTNCAMVFLFSDISEGWPPIYMILGLFLSEHTVYFIKLVVSTGIADIHPEVERDLLIENKSKRSAVLEFGMRVAMQGDTQRVSTCLCLIGVNRPKWDEASDRCVSFGVCACRFCG